MQLSSMASLGANGRETTRGLYPEHGFQTLTEDCEVVYRISAFYAPEVAGGYRYDDATFQITWPLPVTVISERDIGWPLSMSSEWTPKRSSLSDTSPSRRSKPAGRARKLGFLHYLSVSVDNTHAR
jgi:hypothetical protein